VLRQQRRGSGDPTLRMGVRGRHWRASRTPEGPVTLAIAPQSATGEVHGEAWGPGSAWALDQLPDLLGDVERLVGHRNEVLAWGAVLPLVHLDAGDAAAAGIALDAALGDVPPGLLWLPAHAWLGEAAARLGRTDACAAISERLAPHSGRLVQSSFTGCWGAVDRILGLLAGALGEREEAQRRLVDALEQHRRIGAAPLVQRTERDLAALVTSPRREV
jgi:hypothetical protein